MVHVPGTACIEGNICPHFIFALVQSQKGDLQTGYIAMARIISLSTQFINSVWSNSRWGKTVCK